jgi:hypothetical protein
MDIPIGSVNNYQFKQNHQNLINNDYSQLRSPCLQPPFYQGGSQVPTALGSKAWGYVTNEDIKKLLHKEYPKKKPNFNK